MKKTRLFLRTSGGMGVEMQGAVSLDDLPEPLAAQLQTALHPKMLSRMVRSRNRLPVASYPDQMAYDLIVQAGSKKTKRYRFTEEDADPELLDLLDELISIMVDQQLERRKEKETTSTKASRHATGASLPPESEEDAFQEHRPYPLLALDEDDVGEDDFSRGKTRKHRERAKKRRR